MGKRIVDMYLGENLSQRSISKLLNVSRSAVRYHLSKHNAKKSKKLILESMKHTFFKKGHKLGLGKKRLDLVGNEFWKHPNNPIRKGHKMNVTTEVSLYRRKVNRDHCSQCGKKKDYNTKNLKGKLRQINIDVHHIDGNKRNNSQQNLIPLCRSCHSLIHRGGL